MGEKKKAAPNSTRLKSYLTPVLYNSNHSLPSFTYLNSPCFYSSHLRPTNSFTDPHHSKHWQKSSPTPSANLYPVILLSAGNHKVTQTLHLTHLTTHLHPHPTTSLRQSNYLWVPPPKTPKPAQVRLRRQPLGPVHRLIIWRRQNGIDESPSKTRGPRCTRRDTYPGQIYSFHHCLDCFNGCDRQAQYLQHCEPTP